MFKAFMNDMEADMVKVPPVLSAVPALNHVSRVVWGCGHASRVEVPPVLLEHLAIIPVLSVS